MSNICIMGLGYIGLPTASLLACAGNTVHGVDVNKKVVDALNRGEIIIYEPSLGENVKIAVASGFLKASTEPCAADIFIIAVPTPFKDDYKPDLSCVEAATRAIAPHLAHGNLIILESTSPVGTTEKICQWLSDCRPDLVITQGQTFEKQVSVAHCPERVLPGKILQELKENDRVVGGVDATSTELAVEFYKTFVQGTIFPTNSRTAEMVKLTENSYRDVNIAFANELSLICDELDIDVWDTIRLANRHPRVNILRPGPGVGGHCIAVDPWFIVASAPETARLIRTARNVNDSKPHWVIEQVKKGIAKKANPKIACFGLAFKPDIDDLRESPALKIVQMLANDKKASILAVEPHISELPPALKAMSNISLVPIEIALNEADIIVMLVPHSIFKAIAKDRLTVKPLIDACGLLAE